MTPSIRFLSLSRLLVVLALATVSRLVPAQAAPASDGATARRDTLRDSVLGALPVGAYVRALDWALRDGVNGWVTQASPAALRLRLDDGGEHTVLAENLRGLRLRESKSRRYGFQTGLRRGAVAGAMIGIAIHFAGEWVSDAPFADAGPQVVISGTGLAGAAVGGLVGAIVGRQRWRDLL